MTADGPASAAGAGRRVVIVGAGLSGLVAARTLTDAGVDVLLVDKGRSVGGRLATRRIGGARLDHGAQFFTVRTPAFQRRVDDWIERGLVHVWTHGFGDDDGHPRYVATAGMNSLAKDLAAGLDVECSTLAFTLRPAEENETRWEVVIDDGSVRAADAVILTAPLPQTFALLADVGVWKSGDPDVDERIDAVVSRHGIELDGGPFRTPYDRTIALLVTLDRPPTGIPDPGGVQMTDGDLSFVGDNVAKGVSDEPAVTVHASAAWSEEHWEDDADALRDALLDAARSWIGGASVVEVQVKKWRFSAPSKVWPDPCWTTADGTIVVAGDAFAGPRVEGAHNSGLAAAHALVG